jgi:hypothetical protein
MRYAQPSELTEGVIPVLQLRLSDRQFAEMFPIRTVDLDPLASAEPSKAALVRLDSGSYLVVTYGEVSHRAVVEVPRSANPSNVVRELLSEVAMPASAIEWTRDDVLTAAHRPRKAAAPKLPAARKRAEKSLAVRDLETVEKVAKAQRALKTPVKEALRAAGKKLKKAKSV